jgi:hypothetical protein
VLLLPHARMLTVSLARCTVRLSLTVRRYMGFLAQILVEHDTIRAEKLHQKGQVSDCASLPKHTRTRARTHTHVWSFLRPCADTPME